MQDEELQLSTSLALDHKIHVQAQNDHNLQNKKEKKASKSSKKKVKWCCAIVGIILIIMVVNAFPIIAYQTFLTTQTNFIGLAAKAILSNVTKSFPATEKLNYNYSSQVEPMTVVCTCSGQRYSNLQNSLKSFFNQNTYPIEEIIVVDDDIINYEFNALKSKFPNITWISTNLKVGQLYAIDIAYKFVKTEFYFHTEEDWQYLQPGFIDISLKVMRSDPKIGQVLIRWWTDYKGDPQGILDPSINIYSVYCFNPSVKRMSMYNNIVSKFGGFSEYSQFKTFGKGVGSYEQCISKYFAKQGYYGYRIKGEYIAHTGQQTGLSRFSLFFWEPCQR